MLHHDPREQELMKILSECPASINIRNPAPVISSIVALQQWLYCLDQYSNQPMSSSNSPCRPPSLAGRDSYPRFRLAITGIMNEYSAADSDNVFTSCGREEMRKIRAADDRNIAVVERFISAIKGLGEDLREKRLICQLHMEQEEVIRSRDHLAECILVAPAGASTPEMRTWADAYSRWRVSNSPVINVEGILEQVEDTLHEREVGNTALLLWGDAPQLLPSGTGPSYPGAGPSLEGAGSPHLTTVPSAPDASGPGPLPVSLNPATSAPGRLPSAPSLVSAAPGPAPGSLTPVSTSASASITTDPRPTMSDLQ